MDEKPKTVADGDVSRPEPVAVPRSGPNKPKTKPRVKAAEKRKPKRKPYPAILFEKAIQVPLQIKEKNGGNPWASADVAAALGVGSKSSDFFYIAAAARDFGLTVGTRNTKTIELTELGRELAYASSPEVEHAKKLEAFMKIDIFTKVLAHYKGSDLPEMKYLGNTLEREFGLDPAHHEEFSRVFKANCEYLKIGSGSSSPDAERPHTVVVGEPPSKSGLKAFVIMPFTERNEQRPQGFFVEVLNSLIVPAGTEAGFLVETANRQGSDVIQSTIINELLDADLVIADLTDHNPNVMFELGLRMAAEHNKPIALVKAEGTGRVFDVDNMLRVFEYNPNLWRSTIEMNRPELTKHIKAAWDNRQKGASYMKILRSREAVA